jgi:hypothetical protein
MTLKLLKLWLHHRGKRWYALGNGCAGGTTSYIDGKRVHWLNPVDQHVNNYGWFTAGQLFLWGLNRGPIPKRGQS